MLLLLATHATWVGALDLLRFDPFLLAYRLTAFRLLPLLPVLAKIGGLAVA